MVQQITGLIAFFMVLSSQTIFDFNSAADIRNWRIVDDGVMGGRSAGQFQINSDGHGVFKGEVSLENNGGFSSLRYRSEKMSVAGYTKVYLKLKGDGKKYQFRLKSSVRDYHSYINYFTTTGEWQTIEIPLAEFYPSFRGRRLNRSNFSSDSFEEIAFLIGNKKEESFQLLIDTIELR